VAASNSGHYEDCVVTADCPLLGDDVTVGAHAAVCGPVFLGSNSDVGPPVAVLRDIPPDSLPIAIR